MLTPSCVYYILNKKNNNLYVGSAVDFKRRCRQHLYLLRQGKHHSVYLQREFNILGESQFKIYPMIICDPHMLIYYEQVIIDKFIPVYNSNKIAGSMLGFHHSENTKNKLSRIKIGKKSNKVVTSIEKEKLRMRSINNNFSSKSYYNFVSPNEEIIPEIYNLNKFCRENILDSGHMVDVYNSKRKSHKGWTVRKEHN
jgi:group I intron endonuclease